MVAGRPLERTPCSDRPFFLKKRCGFGAKNRNKGILRKNTESEETDGWLIDDEKCLRTSDGPSYSLLLDFLVLTINVLTNFTK